MLGDVYIGMTRGQEVFSIDFIQNSESLNLADINQDELFVVNPSSTELQAHDKFISNLETDNEQ